MPQLPGPTTWRGLPDLRDRSKDTTIWSELPIPCWHVSSLFNIDKVVTYRMIREGQVETTKMFGRIAVKLGSLPQTARCQYIEHLFRDQISPFNILHGARIIMGALDVPRRGLKLLFDQGRVIRE